MLPGALWVSSRDAAQRVSYLRDTTLKMPVEMTLADPTQGFKRKF